MGDFYDRMASLYHLIFQDWDASIERQAAQLAGIIQDRWGAEAKHILDVSCGIGTQAIGLGKRGFLVTASDLSEGAISRAKVEAKRRGVEIDFSISDMRAASTHHQRQFDVVISVDNCITHLLPCAATVWSGEHIISNESDSDGESCCYQERACRLFDHMFCFQRLVEMTFFVITHRFVTFRCGKKEKA